MALAQSPPAAHATPPEVFLLLSAGIAATLAGLLGAGAAALGLVPFVYTMAAPLAVLALVAGLRHPHASLCFAAFAIAPLGIAQREFAGVTVNLPEAIFLALAAREIAGLLRHRQAPFAPAFPFVSVALYLLAATAGIATGFLHGNGVAAVLQDCRQFVEYLVLLWLVIQRIRTPRQAVQLAFCFVLGCSVIAVHGIVQHFTGLGIPANQLVSDLIYHKGIRSGSFYGATPLGGLMILGIGSGIGLALAVRARSARYLLVLCIAVCLAAIVYTKTRASWVALAVALAFLFLSVRPSPKLVVSAVLGALVFAMFMGPAVVQRMTTLSVTRTERSLLERVHYYTAAWHIFRAHPLLGLGWGCYYDIDAIVANGHYVPAERLDARDTATVHSAYLQLLVKTGALGLAAFLLIPLQWGRVLVRERFARTRAPAAHALFAGVTASILGYLLHSGFENFFQWPVMAQSFYLLLGLSLRLGWGALAEDADSPEARP